MTQTKEPPKSVLQKLLDGVETVGNKVPHPAVIFLVLIGLVVMLSHVFYVMGTSVSYQRINPQTHAIEDRTATVDSLLTTEKVVEQRLGAYHGEVPGATGESVSTPEQESRGLAYALYAGSLCRVDAPPGGLVSAGAAAGARVNGRTGVA
jgi:p-aminobenzoyl-glutamate transporter AbgT